MHGFIVVGKPIRRRMFGGPVLFVELKMMQSCIKTCFRNCGQLEVRGHSSYLTSGTYHTVPGDGAKRSKESCIKGVKTCGSVSITHIPSNTTSNTRSYSEWPSKYNHLCADS